MWRDAYIENQVMAADPVELIRMLYRAAVDAMRDARKAVAAGKIQERSDAINRALAIVGELSGSLDHKSGGEISRNLNDLYTYMLQLLMRANILQQDAPLAEAESLLATLSQGWEGVSAARAPSGPAEPPQVCHVYGGGVAEQAHQWSA